MLLSGLRHVDLTIRTIILPPPKFLLFHPKFPRSTDNICKLHRVGNQTNRSVINYKLHSQFSQDKNFQNRKGA